MSKAILLFELEGHFYSLMVNSHASDYVRQSLSETDMNFQAVRVGPAEEMHGVGDQVAGLVSRYNLTRCDKTKAELEAIFD